jgi:hypothetical protein
MPASRVQIMSEQELLARRFVVLRGELDEGAANEVIAKLLYLQALRTFRELYKFVPRALRPKTKPPRISTRRFRFLVEPWGIEPQTSRVRF